jgi:hypothetical protein
MVRSGVFVCSEPFCNNAVGSSHDKCCQHRESSIVPFSPQPEPSRSIDLRHENVTRQRAREYKCPCGGEFDKFERRSEKDGEPLVCPFCGTEKYAHDGAQEGDDA